MCKVTLNNEKNGIELSFESKPSKDVLESIKSQGFRWSNPQKIWYAKQTAERIQFANSLNELGSDQKEITVNVSKENKQVKPIKKSMSLWDATRIPEIFNHEKMSDCKEIAKLVRVELKRFTNCKFSVTSDSRYDHVDVELKSSPYDIESAEYEAVKAYVDAFVNSFRYCTDYDPYGDYGSSYNFYYFGMKDYDKVIIDKTESIENDIKDFEEKKAIANEEKRVQQEKDLQECIKKMDEEKKQYELRIEQEKKDTEEIESRVVITDLQDNKQYFVIGSQFAHLNKNSTLSKYEEECSKSDGYYLQNVKISREIKFTDETIYNKFSNMLLNDFSFLQETGGSATDDNRIQSMLDYNNMSPEERDTVDLYSCNSVAVYLNNKLMYVIDAQGYSYARYVGLVNNVTITKTLNINQVLPEEQKNEYKSQAELIEDISYNVITENNLATTWNTDSWNEYKKLIKEQLQGNQIHLNDRIIQQIETEDLKTAMYRVLQELDTIQEQFSNLELGKQYTIVSDGSFSVSTQHITLDRIENTSYAQYTDAVKIVFTPERKRKQYYTHYHNGQRILVYEGILNIPESLFYKKETKEGMTVTSSLFGCFDKGQFDVVINYFMKQGIKPIVNTYKNIY